MPTVPGAFDADAAVDNYLAPPSEPLRVPGSMRESMAAAVDTNPDTHAELRKIADRTGVPVTALADDATRSQVVKQHNFDSFDFSTYEKSFPESANLLSDTEFAKVAHDDATNMGMIETSLQKLGNVGRALGAGVFSLGQGIFGTVETGAAFGKKYLTSPLDIGGDKELYGAIQSFYGSARRDAQTTADKIMQPALERSGPYERDVYSGFQSVTGSLPGLIASIVTKNPSFYLASGFVQQGGISGGKALDKNLDPLVALGYGIIDGTIEVGTELIPVTKFLGDLHAGSDLLKTLGHQVATEVPGELLATTLQNFNEWAVLNNDKPFQTYLDQLPADLAHTFVATLVAVGAQTGALHIGHRAVQRLQDREAKAQAGEESAQTVEQLTQLAASSKILARDPESFERFIDAANQHSDVQDIYLDPKDLAQSGLDLDALAALSPSVQKQVQLATETGGLLKIPVSEYATTLAPSEFGQSLLDHAKTDPLGMSRNEAKEFMQSSQTEFEAEVTKSMEEGKVNREFMQSREAVHTEILDQLETTNRFTEDVNRQYATLLSNFYAVQASRLGITPQEMFAKYPVGIRAEGIGALSQPANAGVNPERQVRVVDLSQSQKFLKSSDLKETLRGLLGRKIPTADSERLVNILPKNVNHVVYSSLPDQTPAEQKTRRKAVSNIEDLINHAVLIESTPNSKKKAKPDIEAYHRFYVPVSIGGKMHTVRIVTEQTKKGLRIAPGEFDLYDVIPEGRTSPPSTLTPQAGVPTGESHERNPIPVTTAERGSSVPAETGSSITIRQMLSGVKDTAGNAYFQSVEPQGLQSTLTGAASTMKQEKGTGEQMLAILKNTPGVKAEEIEWTGLDEFLKGKKSVTRQEITEYLRENNVQIKEVTLGRTEREPSIEERDGKWWVLDQRGYDYSSHATEAEAEEQLYELVQNPDSELSNTDPQDETKFGQYTLPGGENYREVLMSIPNPGDKLNARRHEIEKLGHDATPEQKQEWADIMNRLQPDERDFEGNARYKNSPDFISSHFDQRNIIAHARLNDRVDTDGKKVLHVEEIQSDWHQAGRKKGYQGDAPGLSVPDAPFKKTWHEMAVRRVLQMAAEGGYDRVTWTTGEQQAERFDLSKQVKEIAVPMVNEGSRSVRVDDANGGSFKMMVNDKGVVEGFHSAAQFTGKTLDEVIGKDMAAKVMAVTEPHNFSGEGLKVGGEGMKGFYDKILPQYISKFAKKFGSKVGTTEIQVGRDHAQYGISEYGDGTFSAEFEGESHDFDTWEEANKWINSKTNLKVHSVDITPEMREAAHEFALFQGEDTRRGSFNPETSVITLLKAADLSTFLHESGHFFLETLNKIALDPNAPAELKADMDTTLKWLGVGSLEEWNSKSLEEQRPAHEQFARGFEAYLFEGKSPNVELASIFGRFRDWLLMVYKNAKHLNVGVSDDIRKVFDRLLATNEAIAEAESLTGFQAMFASAEDAGMAPDEWAQYQKLGQEATEQARADLGSKTVRDIKWLSNARDRKLKELQRDAEAKRRSVRREVTDEVMSEPVNQARTFLRRGETADGVKIEGTHRLDIAALKETYGEEPDAIWRTLENKYGKYGMIGNDGLHPDAVAEQFGFSSGDELVKALVSGENPRDKIQGLTDRRMLERYGDISDPQSLERAADAAIHNDARARFVATEVNALQKATGKRKILTEAAKQYAGLMIGRLRVRDVKPSRYTAAEAKAARAAEKAMRAGDIETAAIEKRSQLVQLHAAKAAMEALDDTEKAIRYFNKFNKDSVRSKLSHDYTDQIDALLERFDLRKGVTLKAIDKRKSLVDWLATQAEVGLEPDIPVEMLDAANRKHYKDMTVSELRGLVDTVKQIEHLGKLKNKLLTAKDNRDFEKTITDLADSIYANRTVRKLADNTTRANAADRAARLFKGYIASHRKIASLSRQMDGVKDGGAMWETFIRSMNVAGDTEARLREGATEKMAHIAAPLFKTGKMGGKGVYFETLGRSLNREERIALALNTGNSGNMQRLLDGEGWTVDQIQPVLDLITPVEAKFVQDVWDHFESYRPQIAAKEKRIYGKEPEWVEPVPITLGGIELRGGYFPIKYDHRRNLAAEQHNDAETAKQQMKGAYTSATTRRSFTKSRAEEVRGRPLVLTMNGLYTGLNEVIHDLSWHEWLIDANRLLRNKHLDGTIRAIYGAETVQQYKKAVEDIAAGEMGASDGDFEKVLGNLRSGASVAGIGLNVVSAAVNVTGITQSFVRIGPRWVMQGVSRWASNPHGFLDEIYTKSDFMRLRGKTMNRELNEIQSLLQDKTKVRAAIDRYSYLPMTMTQIAVDAPTWYGAYQKALAEGNEEERAVALADQAVLDAQGGGQVKDLAAIQRGSNFKKLFTTFYGYFSTTLQLTAEQTAKTNFKDPHDVMRLGGDYLMLYTVPALLGTILKGIIMGDAPDWWDDPGQLVKQVANDQIGYLLSPLVGVRELSGGAQKALGVSVYNSSYGGPAGLRFLSEYDKLAQQVGQGEFDRALLRSLINVAGISLRLPSSQINRTIDGATSIMEGNSINPASLITGGPRP